MLLVDFHWPGNIFVNFLLLDNLIIFYKIRACCIFNQDLGNFFIAFTILFIFCLTGSLLTELKRGYLHVFIFAALIRFKFFSVMRRWSDFWGMLLNRWWATFQIIFDNLTFIFDFILNMLLLGLLFILWSFFLCGRNFNYRFSL